MNVEKWLKHRADKIASWWFCSNFENNTEEKLCEIFERELTLAYKHGLRDGSKPK